MHSASTLPSLAFPASSSPRTGTLERRLRASGDHRSAGFERHYVVGGL